MNRTLLLALLLAVLAAAVWFTAPEPEPTEPEPVAWAPKSEPPAPRESTGAVAEPDSKRVAPASEQSPSGAKPDAAPARSELLVLDEATGEPVPFLALRVHALDGGAACTTDAKGVAAFVAHTGAMEVECTGEGTPQDLVQTARVPEAWKSGRTALAPSPSGTAEVRVRVGPTWRVRLDGAADPTKFVATFSSADPAKAFDKVHARIRTGEFAPGSAEPWLRFGPLARLVGGGPPWRISVVSDDGLWAGAATVEVNSGVQREVLRIAVEPRARLSGRVLDSKGTPVPKQWLQLWPPAGSFGDPAKRPLLQLSDAEGNYAFSGVPAGRYTLKSELRGHADYSAEVEVAALSALAHDVHLAAVESGGRTGRVAGTVRSRSGTYAGALKAALRLSRPPTLETQPIAWQDVGGIQVGRFAFENVAEESPTVFLFGDDLFAIDPPEAVAAAFGVDELEFTVQDGGPSVELAFTVKPADGERLQRFELFFQTRLDTAPRRTTAKAADGTARVRGLEPGLRYTWRLRAEGFPTQWGEGFAPAQSGAVEIVPRTGFGLEVLANGANGKPLEGASISFDGAVVGATGADGIAHVYAERAPAKIQVAWKDWIPASKSAVKADGTWAAMQDRVIAVLEAPR